HPEGALRSGPGRRRRAVVALLVRHAADAEAGPGRGRPVLDHLHVQRLQHRVRAHPRRAHQHHPPVRDVLAHDRAGERPHRRGRGDLAVPVPAADVRGVGAAALRAQTGLLMSRRTLGPKVTVLAPTASVIIGTVAAYALSRLKFRGVNSFGTGIFVTYLVPTSLLFLPLAQVINWIGLADSKWALVVTYPTFLVPFCTW